MSFVAKSLRQNRFQIITNAQALINGENVTAETMETFDSMMTEADTLMSQITRVEKAANEASKIDEIIGAAAERNHVSVGQQANEVERFKAGFVAALRQGAKLHLTAQDKSALEDYQAAASLTGSAGGFTVPTDLMKTIFTALLLEGGVRSVARIIQTAQGNPIDMPMNDDTAQVATLVGENASLGTATDLTFTKSTLGAYKYTSGIGLISKELLQDSAFNFDSFVQDQLVHRFTRGTNLAYTTGTGSAQPQGVLTAAASGKVGATGQVTSVLYTDLVDLEHSVGYPYRRNAKWMFSDAMLKSVKRLVDGQGRPLFLPNMTVGAPDTILGYDIVVNADLPVPAANAKSAIFGDFSQFIIRDVLDLNFQVLLELFAASGQIGIVGLMRTDSRLASVGNCLRYYANSAT